MKKIAIILLAATATGVIAQGQISGDALEKTKQLTVMINATIDGDTRPGAGIIFGLAKDQIYIATANHLVRRGLSKASDIQVEFKWLPGQPVAAELLTYYDDRALDLAVIVVDAPKARLGQARLPFDGVGDSATLKRDSAVTAIGYPNGTAYDVSAGQISQMEAVLLKYRVAGLVPGGYSGGPLVDRNGRIVGMIRQDQPPDGEATRIDLILQQLKAWNFEVRLQDSQSGVVSPAKPPASSGGDAFRDALLRYIAEAPSGFRALGAKQIGNWNPSVNLPDATSCRGGGTAKEPFIECVLYRTSSESEAAEKLEDLIDLVQAALPGWKSDRVNLFNAYFSNRQAAAQSVNVNLGVAHRETNYDLTLTVRSSTASDTLSTAPGPSPTFGRDPFQEVLQQYITAAPDGFVSLGAQAGNWMPSVNLPGSTRCSGTTRGPGIVSSVLGTYIICTLFHTEDLNAADRQFTDIGAKVRAALQGQDWEKPIEPASVSGSLQLTFKNGSTHVLVVRTVYSNGYEVYVAVRRLR